MKNTKKINQIATINKKTKWIITGVIVAAGTLITAGTFLYKKFKRKKQEQDYMDEDFDEYDDIDNENDEEDTTETDSVLVTEEVEKEADDELVTAEEVEKTVVEEKEEPVEPVSTDTDNTDSEAAITNTTIELENLGSSDSVGEEVKDEKIELAKADEKETKIFHKKR